MSENGLSWVALLLAMPVVTGPVFLWWKVLRERRDRDSR